jgi:hypothetical protein
LLPGAYAPPTEAADQHAICNGHAGCNRNAGRSIRAMARGVMARWAVRHQPTGKHTAATRCFQASAESGAVNAIVPVSRPSEDRLTWDFICAADLTPQTAAADFLACAMALADQHVDRRFSIAWIGGGDLHGVFAAQLLPANLSQKFLGCPEPLQMFHAFAQSAFLVAPARVIGSIQSAAVRHLVVNDETGWAFDARRPATLLAALDRAITRTPADRTRMREAARMRAKAWALAPRAGSGAPPVQRGHAQAYGGSVTAAV